jgi:hypothetical protein
MTALQHRPPILATLTRQVWAPGALPPAALAQLITATRDLDMDEVRAKVAARVS